MKFLQNKIDAQLAVDRVCETVRQLVAERSESVRIQSEAMRALMQQNRELHDRLLAVYAPAAAQMTSQYELGRLQLQPVPPVPAVPTVSQPEPGVGV